jgi:hypothetical protein
MTSFGQPLDEAGLQLETRVIGSQVYAHDVSLAQCMLVGGTLARPAC